MEQFEQILSALLSPFRKNCVVTCFMNHLSRHLRTCFNHPNHKNHHHFNQHICEYLMEKHLSNKLFCKCSGHSK